MGRTDIELQSGGERVSAWLYRPDGPGPHGCVVMAHGFAGTRDAGLEAFAERFAREGMAVLLFDYRHFGDSGGEPRQLLDIRRQQADYRAAIAHARGLEGVDADGIALWGSSFSGGHVTWLAAREPRIAAAVAQVPFMDGRRNLPHLGARNVLMLTWHGLRDAGRSLARRSPHLIPAVASPGELGAMTTPSSNDYLRVAAGSRTWRNEVAARIALAIGLYRPIKWAPRIPCPYLVCVADDDDLTPPEWAVDAAALAPHGEVKRYPGGHFDLYDGPHHDAAAGDQAAFLARHISSRAPEHATA